MRVCRTSARLSSSSSSSSSSSRSFIGGRQTQSTLYRARQSRRRCDRRVARSDLCRVNERGFCATFPVSRSSFAKTVPLFHTHPFNGSFSGTTQVSQYQKEKTNLDFTEARDSEWQWHQLGHMQVCTSLQTDNHASTPLLFFYRSDALPASQPTASKH